MDGETLFQLTEKDICELVPPIGLTKKILYLVCAIKISLCISLTPNGRYHFCLGKVSGSCQRTNFIPLVFTFTITYFSVKSTCPATTSGSIQLSPPAQQQSPSGSTATESTSIASSAAANTNTIAIPDHWHLEVEDCLRKKCLTLGACQEMVRTMVSQLIARSQRPNRNDCDQVARRLIWKYPFTTDDLGSGYVSYVLNLV